MKVQKVLSLMMISLFTFNSWSQTSGKLGIPALRVTGDDVESDQKVLWVEGESFNQGTCGVSIAVANMNKDTCKIHTKIPLKLMKSLLGIIHAETREGEIQAMNKALDLDIKERNEVATTSKKIQSKILDDVKAFNQDVWNVVNDERGTEKRLAKIISLLSPSAKDPKAAAMIARVKAEQTEFPKRINKVMPYNSSSYVDSIDGNIRAVENSVKTLQASRKTISNRVHEVEDYLDILSKPLAQAPVGTPAWNKYFTKFSVPKEGTFEAELGYMQYDHDFSKISWNFKVLNIVAEYEKSQVQKNAPVGYLAYIQKLNKVVSASGKKWAVVSRDHSLLSKKLAKKRRAFDNYYIADWMDSESVEALGMNKLSPSMLYTCENVFGKGWSSPTIKELEASAGDLRDTALFDLIGDKTILSSQRYIPHLDAQNMAHVFNMQWSRRTTISTTGGAVRLCVNR